ncbi:MAG TPA: ABC transporter ATP-binding protein [Planctomycetaceae bacterium]|jgi:ABC-2 type transport system ATP-binding protein|nr:ABC transporter ATP-binding protein [Planctomycetaceae bacterium]
MQPLVEISGLVKRYGDFTAVNSLTLTIPRGCIFALLGPNGAGKTTTIKLMMGMLQATSGTLRIDGLDAFADSVAVKEHVGYLPDEPAFYDFMRGSEIIRFAGEMHGLPRSVIQERGSQLAERLHLADALGEFAENYSRGMKKKLGLICALLHQPDLLILDEPTNGLDPQGTVELHGLMRESVARGNTVIFSTHLLDQAEKLSDRVAVVNHGSIAAEGSLAELRQRFGADSSLEALFFKLTEAAPSAEPVVASSAKEGST